MAICDLRFLDRKQVKRMIARCELKGAVIDMDKDGFFAHSFDMPTWLAILPPDQRAAQAALGAVVTVKDVPAPKPAPVRAVKENGACAQIRAWARANPDADKAAAVAAFPDLNASTVAIQLRKVRLGQV